MSKVTIRFIRKDEGSKRDDVLTIFEDEDFDEMYRVVFRPTEQKTSANEFYLEQGRVVDYVSNILRTLPHDADPFRYVQIDTVIHPSVLYNVDDLVVRDIRHMIEDIVESALRRPVAKVRVKA